MFSKIYLQIRQIEYSCSPGGVDEWELYSLGENFLYSSKNLNEVMDYVMKNFSDYRIELEIKSLNWWHIQQGRESA